MYQKQIDVEMIGLSVMIAIPAGRPLEPAVVRSLIDTVEVCACMNIPCDVEMVAGGAVVQWVRDELADAFLKSNHNRLFMVDSDIVWTPNDFLRILAFSKLHPVVGATYPAKREPTTYFVSYDEIMTVEDDGLIEVNGFGLGFTAIDRKVLLELVERSEIVHDAVTGLSMPSLFKVGSVNGNRQGEDMAFLESIRELGYPVMLDPGVDIGHIGTKVYRGTFRDGMKLEQW